MKALTKKVSQLINESRYDKACNVVADKLGFKLNILGSEFKSMDWDKDKQKRNVFKCQLVRGDKQYNFEFGSSIVDSCDYISEIESLNPNDKIKIYAGLKTEKGISADLYLNLTLKEAQNLDSEYIQLQAVELENRFIECVANHNDNLKKKFAVSYLQSTALYAKNLESGAFIQCIQNAVKRKLTELKENQVLSKDKPLTGEQKEPTLYGVLSCLQKYDVGDFEEFCDMFGYDNDSRQTEKTYKAVVKEYEGLSNMFNEDELQLLSEIN